MERLVAWKSEESICLDIKLFVSLPMKYGYSKNVGVRVLGTGTALVWQSRYSVARYILGTFWCPGTAYHTPWIHDGYFDECGFGMPFSFLILFDVLHA